MERLCRHAGTGDALRSLAALAPQAWALLDERALAEAADLLDRAGLHCLAERIYRCLLGRLPNDPSVIYRYALAAWSRGDPDAALARAELVPVSGWRHGQAIHMLALAAVKNDEVDLARRLLAHGLSLKRTGHGQTMRKLAARVAYWADRDPELVVELVRGDVSGDPGLAVLGAMALTDLARPAEAMKLLEPLLLDDPPGSDALVCAFEMMRRAGHPGAALRWINLLFASQSMATISSQWARYGFRVEALRCASLEPSGDGRLASVVMTIDRWHPLAATAIDSILAQTHRNLELIVVTDGAAARDVEALAAHVERDTRVRIECLPSNVGTYVAKNHGIDKADGDFLAFMDSDDWSHPQRLQRAIALLDHIPGEQVAVCDDGFRLDGDGGVALRGPTPVRFAPISLVLRAGCLSRIGRFDAVRCSADSEYCRRIDTILGDGAVHYSRAVTIVQSFSEHTLTGGGRFGYDWRELTGDRFRYVQNYRAWHRLAAVLGLDMRASGDPAARSFEAPESVLALPECGRAMPFATIAGKLLPGLDAATASLDLAHDLPDNGPGERPAASGGPITVCMLCHGSNRHIVGHAVSGLLNQTVPATAIHLWLHDYGDADPLLPADPRIRLHRADRESAAAPIAAPQATGEGLVLMTGDEYLYPPDYIATLVGAVERYGRRVIVGVEAAVLPSGPAPVQFAGFPFARRNHEAVDGYRRDWAVNFLGASTLAFHTDLLQADTVRPADPWLTAFELAAQAQLRGWPMVSVRRPRHWLRPIVASGEERLLDWLLDDDDVREAILRILAKVPRWRLLAVPRAESPDGPLTAAGPMRESAVRA